LPRAVPATNRPAMHIICPRCQRTLEFSKDRPSFCGYCGSSIADSPVLASSGPGTRDDQTVIAQKGPGTKGSRVGELVGGYRLLRELGAGGMGQVYEAEHTSTGRRVAIKVIGLEYANSSQEAVERFRQEGRLASMIAHPRCVFVLAVDGMPAGLTSSWS
jgi:eukaryotic-like serine/threonine-protein kinase